LPAFALPHTGTRFGRNLFRLNPEEFGEIGGQAELNSHQREYYKKFFPEDVSITHWFTLAGYAA